MNSFVLKTRFVKKEEICSLCGLFGQHKGHTLLVDAQLREINKGMLAQFQAEREQFTHAQDYLRNESFSVMLNDLMKKLLLTLKKELEDVFLVSSAEGQGSPQVKNHSNVPWGSETN